MAANTNTLAPVEPGQIWFGALWTEVPQDYTVVSTEPRHNPLTGEDDLVATLHDQYDYASHCWGSALARICRLQTPSPSPSRLEQD